MKMQRLLGALFAGLMLVSLPVWAAEQASYVQPVAGPMNMATFAGTYLNPALRAIASCHNGTSAPANGPSGAPLAYQCWVDTTANPSLYKIYDGASWISLGSINTTTHAWVPFLTGDTVVGRATTDTLTNKTLTSPVLTTPSLGVATATSINKVAITAPASGATLTIPDGVTLTGPASSGTAMTLGNPETVTGVKTFGSSGAVGRLKVAGSTSGSTILDAAATASGTLTLPAATDTLVGKATSDTLTNKTFDTAGTGNSLSINGVAATANTGTGAVARAVSPSFTTPALGAATATSLAMGSVLLADTVGGVRFISNDATNLLVQYGSGVAGGGAVAFYTQGTERGRISASASDWTFGVAAATQGTLTLSGATSGGTKLTALAAASGTLTLPSATDTLIGKATTDTLTNKTFDTAGAGNSFSINGVAATANTGTGSVVRATSPTLVTPALGTPASGVLTNVTGLPISTGVSGLGTSVSTALGVNVGTAGSLIVNGGALGTPSSGTATNLTGLPLSGLTAQGAYTIVANNSGSSAAPTAVDVTALTSKASPVSGDIVLIQDSAASNAFKKTTVGALSSAGSVASIAGNTGAFTLANGIDNSVNQIQLTAARRTLPTIQKFSSGSGTYTTPANVLWIEVEMVGGGGGGSGSGSSAGGNGGAGGDTTFGTTLLVASGGGGGAYGSDAGTGGSASLGTGPIGLTVAGGCGSAGGSGASPGSQGAFSPYGGAGAGALYTHVGGAAIANSGSGGGGAGGNAGIVSGNGGCAGGFLRAIIYSPSSTYSYAVGAAGTAGTAGVSGFAGGAGASGRITVTEHYGS